MTKKLKFIGTGNPSDPINQVAGDILAVRALNKHEATDGEIRDELRAASLDTTAENIARVREIVSSTK
jgi:hypothetical protein